MNALLDLSIQATEATLPQVCHQSLKAFATALTYYFYHMSCQSETERRQDFGKSSLKGQ